MFPMASPMLLTGGAGGLNVDDVFATKLYTDGFAASELVSVPFDPDFVWHKERAGSSIHGLWDILRGNSQLSTNLTSAQSGTTAGYGTPRSGGFNKPGNSVGATVAWSLKRAPKFFDIVTYTGNGVAGRQIAHGLGIKPGMIIIKELSAASNWVVYHQSRGATKRMFLNTTATEGSSLYPWNNTEPTATAFTIGYGPVADSVNDNGVTYVAYLFAHDTDPSGIIQCGQYIGNNSSMGTVVNLGWEPQFVLMKRAAGIDDWLMFDNKRVNAANEGKLSPNTTTAEVEMQWIDFLSTGFQSRLLDSAMTTGGEPYIYMAIRKGAL